MKIKKAQKTDAQRITELTFRSKNYWGYGASQIEAWRDDLTMTPGEIEEQHVYILISINELIGFYAFEAESDTVVKLHSLFIEPKYIRKGYGKLLMKDFLKRALFLNFEKVILDSDPNAVEFYRSMGFKTIGKFETQVKDRFLSVMEINVADFDISL